MAGGAGHVLGHAQGVHDCLLGALHHGFVESVADLVEQNLDWVNHARSDTRNFVGGGKTDHDLARSVGSERADPAEAQGGAFAQAVDLRRQERRIGGHHADDGTGVAHALLGLRELGFENLAYRGPSDGERTHDAEVALHQHAQGVGERFSVATCPANGHLARTSADASLEVTGHHTGACSHAAFGHRATFGLLDGAIHVLGAHVPTDDVVEP